MNKEKYIFEDIAKKYQYLKNNNYNVVALFLQGSQNYELDVYDDNYKSDIDAKAIVLPTLQDIVLNKQPISTTIVLENNEHIEVKDIRIMKDMFIKQNISYIELLYTKFKIINPDYKCFIDNLLNIKDDISSINNNQFLRCIKGMSMEKYKALEHPYPNTLDKIEKFGYDPKQLHHIMRLNEFIHRYLEDNEDLKNCYISNMKNYLINVKKGLFDLSDARYKAIEYNKNTKDICDKFITKNEIINYETIKRLDNIVYNIIEFSLKKELLVNKYDYISVKQIKAPFKTIKDKSVKMTIKDYNNEVKDNQMVDYSIFENIVINNIYD